MLTFLDYVAREYAKAIEWNYDNSYSFLTATSDAILSFQTPSAAALNVASLNTANFASSYTLSAPGQLDGSLSYLYSNISLDHVPSKSTAIPLKRIVEGYRDVPLPVRLDTALASLRHLKNGRKPTLLHATLLLPPPSTLTAVYSRRVRPETLLSFYLNSRSAGPPTASGSPAASALAHIQYDTGRCSLEGLASTDSGLLGIRGLWNFGIGKPDDEFEHEDSLDDIQGNPCMPLNPEMLDRLSPYYRRLSSKPSLLSAGAEFYYSPFSHVIGLSTGLRFTTLASHIVATDGRKSPSKPLAGTSAALASGLLAPANIVRSSFPYTMTVTLNPIIGALSSSYSVRATSNLALSSRFDFNVYSWESQYVLGAEIWRGRGRQTKSKTAIFNEDGTVAVADKLAWTDELLHGWFTPEEQALKAESSDRKNENVVKLRIDDGFNMGALWTGRIKGLLVNAGVSVSPITTGSSLLGRQNAMILDAEGRRKRWTGKVGLSITYAT